MVFGARRVAWVQHPCYPPRYNPVMSYGCFLPTVQVAVVFPFLLSFSVVVVQLHSCPVVIFPFVSFPVAACTVQVHPLPLLLALCVCVFVPMVTGPLISFPFAPPVVQMTVVFGPFVPCVVQS